MDDATKWDDGDYDPISLLILQPTPFCNLDCDYCYLPNRSVTRRMEPVVLERAIDVVLRSGLVGPRLDVVWHAGEPLVVPPDYYEAAARTILERAPDRTIAQSLQTNGTLIDDRWCAYFKQHNVRVGVSLDGPAHVHDRHRVDRAGRGSHARVMRGIASLQENHVDFHVIAVVTAASLDYPDEIFSFFVDNGVKELAFNFEEKEAVHTASSLEGLSERVRAFMQRVFELNLASPASLQIREFDQAFRALSRLGSPRRPWLGNDQVRPFGIVSIDCDGNTSTFSPELLGAASIRYPSFAFGNVLRHELIDLLGNATFVDVAREIAAGVRLCEQGCSYFDVCGGGAPSNKLYENGTFASMETLYCRTVTQIPVDIVLQYLEGEAGIRRERTSSGIAASAG